MKNDESRSIVPIERIEKVIYIIRGQKVLLDRDLALLYVVETKKLLQAVKRNSERFPEDFMFQLTKNELENWRSQFVTSNSSAKMGLRRQPYVFTELGVAMLSSVLRSPQAVAVNMEIMRAFVRLRHIMATHEKMNMELSELKSFLLKHSNANDREFRQVWQAIEKLSAPLTEKEQRKIGFDLG